MNDRAVSVRLDEVLPYLIPREVNPLQPEEESLSFPPTFPPTREGEEEFLATPLTLLLSRDGAAVELKGVAQRILRDRDGFVVQEGIVLNRQSDFFGRSRELLRLRAIFFALALCRAGRAETVRLRLSVHAEGEVTYQEECLSEADLTAEAERAAAVILTMAPLFQREEKDVVFPYPTTRQGQKKLIQAVWNGIKNRTKVYASAPTGTGKTVAVLYPALKALAAGKLRRVYYTAPKNTLKKQAAQAVDALGKGAFRTLVLTAKSRLCPTQSVECLREACEYREQFYQALPAALAFLSSFSCVTETELTRAAAEFHLCPFELARHYQAYCDVVIGDYNHLFDPTRAVFRPEGDCVLLVDEAHNLPRRMQESYSETLAPSDLDFFFRHESHLCRTLREHFEGLTLAFSRLERERVESRRYHAFHAPEELGKAACELLPKLSFVMRGGFGEPDEEEVAALRELFSKIQRFTRLYRDFSSDFVTIFPPEGGGKIYPVDPREKIRRACEPWRSVVFFSATLSPQDYYFALLAGEEADEFLSLPSPFPTENLYVGRVTVDVSHAQRFATAPKICSIIRSAVSVRAGHYMVFLPSFEYLSLVVQEFKKRNFNSRILVQKKGMGRREAEAFLQAFRAPAEESLIGFCVLGGIFAEGIDLKGEALSGAIVVGTGFPPPSPEGEAECEAWYKRELDGRAFAYTLPGWNRVLQAAGRIIRSETDRGFLLLCDARLEDPSFRELFPDFWQESVEILRESQLRDELTLFWQ